MKKFFKKLVINLSLIIISIILIYLFYNYIFPKFQNKHKLEYDLSKLSENIENSPFSVSKVIIYSSGYGENKNTTFQKGNWILDIFQYSDIAIYIDNSSTNLSSENTVKKLSLENISISTPKIGTPALYYLDSLNFGTANVDENYKLEKSLEFTVLNDENKNGDIYSNTPVFFTDCSNPITLKYINKQIKENYTVTSNEPIFFNGKLLKLANINLKDLDTNISFTINLESNDNKKYSYQLSLPICLENTEATIYDGSILVENEYGNYKFLETSK